MLLGIQALRAVAAWLVVGVHLELLLARAGVPQSAAMLGNAGVDLFFVISGFVMAHTTAGRPLGPGEFLRRRIARIVPLYWAVTFAVFGLALVAPSLLQSTAADWLHLVKSLLFVPYARADGATMPIVFVGWTLNLEMLFYGLFALGLTARRGAWLVPVTVLTGLVGLGLTLHAETAWFRLYTTPMVLEFVFGMGLAVLWRRLPVRPSRVARGMAWGALAAGAAGFVGLPLAFPAVDRLLVAGLPALLTVGAVLALERQGVAPRSRSLQLFGDASYAVYLTHFFVTQAFVKAAGVLDLHGVLPVAATVAGCYGAVTAAGVGVHLLVEKPLTRFARSLLVERATPAAAASAAPQG